MVNRMCKEHKKYRSYKGQTLVAGPRLKQRQVILIINQKHCVEIQAGGVYTNYNK